MNTTSETKEIEGATFQFISEPGAGGPLVRCVPQDKRYLPLCAVVETAWRYSPARLLKSVHENHGQSFEGEVSFAYHQDYPDELEPGVTVDFLGEELVVSEEMFRSLVADFAAFSLREDRQLQAGGETGNDALLPLLAALTEQR